MGMKVTSILKALKNNDGNISKTAAELVTDRSNLYRQLDKLEKDGLIDKDHKVIISEKLLNIYLELASEIVDENRLDVKDATLIIYNPIDNDKQFDKEQFRQNRGYYMSNITYGDDVLIDLNRHFITEEEFIEYVKANEQWLEYTLGKEVDNPFDYVDMEDIYKGTWKKKIALKKQIEAIEQQIVNL